MNKRLAKRFRQRVIELLSENVTAQALILSHESIIEKQSQIIANYCEGIDDKNLAKQMEAAVERYILAEEKIKEFKKRCAELKKQSADDREKIRVLSEYVVDIKHCEPHCCYLCENISGHEDDDICGNCNRGSKDEDNFVLHSAIKAALAELKKGE